MAIDLIIRGAQVVTPGGVAEQDLYIDGGKFVDASSAAKQTIDANGLTAFPGLIDSHVHFNEPGRTDWEGIATGSAALAAGGGTCFFDMPLNSSPPTLDGASFDLKLAAARASAVTDFALWGGLTPGNLDKLEELAGRGVIGFKAFMCSSGINDFERADDLTLLRGMEIASRLGLPVAVHAENDELTSRLTHQSREAGHRHVADYLATRPIVAELDAIKRAITFAQDTGCSLHIVHISSAKGSAEMFEGKHLWRKDLRGPVDVTGETCPHYLTLADTDMIEMGAPAKCSPPLRSTEEIEALWAQLLAGGIDFVASDHSPAPESMKKSDDFFKVWGGISGVQSTLAILLSRVPKLPRELIGQLIATNVASRYRLPGKGRIAPGYDADLSLVDEQAIFTLTREQLLDRHKHSPYVGRTFQGQVKRTIVRGTTVFADEQIVSPPIGQLVRPEVA